MGNCTYNFLLSSIKQLISRKTTFFPQSCIEANVFNLPLSGRCEFFCTSFSLIPCINRIFNIWSLAICTSNISYTSRSRLQLKWSSCEWGKSGIQQARLRSCSCLLSTEPLSVHHSNGSSLEYTPSQKKKITAQPVLMWVMAYCSA